MNLLGVPTLEFCEKAGPGLIKRPFYAISNLAYILVGFLILRDGKGSILSKSFGFSSLFIGLASFFYDATHTYLSQLIDLLGMFVFVHLIIYFSSRRYFSVSKTKLLSIQTVSIALGLFSIIIFKSFSGEFVFGAYIIFALILEYLLWNRGQSRNIKLWIYAVAVFVVGFILWLPDAMAIWCDPNDYVNGRSVFHAFTSATIFLLYKYYKVQEIK